MFRASDPVSISLMHRFGVSEPEALEVSIKIMGELE
jgi:hypothetical protein